MSLSFRGVAQFLRWHRRGAGLVAICVALVAALGAVQSAHGSGVPVVVATHDLSPGAALARSDLTIVVLPDGLAPDGSFADAEPLVGQPLSVGLTRGTPITTAALTASSLANRDAGEMLVPFRVHDADVARLLRIGDRLTIVATTVEGTAVTVAEHLRVAQLPSAASGGLTGGTSSGALIVVSAPRDVAQQVAAASDQWLGVIIE